ncbi:hypothetical protein [Kitasatospora kazusensis]|uniref:hypothetical protein n=1 Tax=Kitasatospora kazusensis TaxID=407974 RepID=UPI0031E2CB17
MTPATTTDRTTTSTTPAPRAPRHLNAAPGPAPERLAWPGHSAHLPWRHPT